MEIKGFKAYRFNSDVVGDSGKCIAPPYDVINPAQQNNLYQQNQHNIVRVILGKKELTDNDKNNQYTRAADFLNDWIKKNALKQDDKETIYAYVQEFEIAGKKYQRSGFIALSKLAQFGSGVQPHEKTLDGPKADRLKLTMATAAQFELVFMLYDDSQVIADNIIKKAAQKKSLIEFVDDDGVKHQLFAIDSPEEIGQIQKMMAQKEGLIADGHHRYETALNYYNLTKNPNAQWLMIAFVNMHNEGLVVLPTHRLVGNLMNYNTDELIKNLQQNFKVTQFEYKEGKNKAKSLMQKRMAKAFEQGENAFGIYDGKSFYYIMLKNKNALDSLPMSTASKSLDVVVLHKLILEGILGIGDEALAGESNIEYIKDIGEAVDEAIAKVDSGEMQVLFFMNPTKVQQVRAVAAENEKMPQKSTFFYPKIFSGLTINKL
ncbi:MAG: hypothetical protein A2Y10_11060 [Planctomycetes bacterium GWF2_41_51]|nr:MAG: hypothetical protein A2Y10_11060 [Planctomycetes bacterium GWF2_41_51]HBG28412.1 DUF1015 domain-containing protein [Phycisphaerales bacterium]